MSDERRQEYRESRQERLYVQIRHAPEDSLAGNTYRCDTADISASGLRIHFDKPLLPGAMLELWVSCKSNGRKYLLTGEVRWSREVGNRFQTGIALRDARNTDYPAWQADFAA